MPPLLSFRPNALTVAMRNVSLCVVLFACQGPQSMEHQPQPQSMLFRGYCSALLVSSFFNYPYP